MPTTYKLVLAPRSAGSRRMRDACLSACESIPVDEMSCDCLDMEKMHGARASIRSLALY